MAFPATGVTHSDAFDRLQRAALKMRQKATTFNAVAAAQSIGTQFILDYAAQLARFLSVVTGIPTDQDFRDHVTAELASEGYVGDIVADFQAMQTAAQAVRDAIFAQRAVLWSSHDLTADLDLVETEFTPAQTANFRTLNDALIATITI